MTAAAVAAVVLVGVAVAAVAAAAAAVGPPAAERIEVVKEIGGEDVGSEQTRWVLILPSLASAFCTASR